VHTEDIEYSYAGTRLVGEIAFDETKSGSRPAILIAHDAGGLSAHPKSTARRLAELGYVAFALDYYGDGQPLPPEQIGARFGELMGSADLIRGIGGAGLEVLLANEFADPGRVAAIGYCFGGTMALELARGGADLAAVVGFHSGLSTNKPAEAGVITGTILVCIGADDPIIPPPQRLAFEEEMRGAGVDWRMDLYGGAVHSFTSPGADGSNPAIRYDRRADELSWRAMTDLFTEVF
jgi:dienelactone hydrolase